MSKPRGHDVREYTFHPGRNFELNYYPETGACNIVYLDDRELAILREMVACFPRFPWIWGLPSPRRNWTAAQRTQWSDITAFIEDLESALVSVCDATSILNELKRLNAIVAGEAVDLFDINGNLLETVNYAASGNPTLHRLIDDTRLGEIRDKLNALGSLASDSTGQAGNVELQNIVTQLANQNTNLSNQTAELQDQAAELANQNTNLSNIYTKLEELRTMLETRMTAETTAGNTRSADLEAVLDAIENVLGGTYVP